MRSMTKQIQAEALFVGIEPSRFRLKPYLLVSTYISADGMLPLELLMLRFLVAALPGGGKN